MQRVPDLVPRTVQELRQVVHRMLERHLGMLAELFQETVARRQMRVALPEPLVVQARRTSEREPLDQKPEPLRQRLGMPESREQLERKAARRLVVQTEVRQVRPR